MTVWPQIPSKKLQYFVQIVCNNLGDDFIYIMFTVCAHRCMTNPTCSAYHYKKETNDCLLIPRVLIKTKKQLHIFAYIGHLIYPAWFVDKPGWIKCNVHYSSFFCCTTICDLSN